ncbi:iron dicitrate transport regulator FecR [Pseudoroseomonas rhizosphaerae]|uniref:Iron dicitrate transport regulator FecR n=1 Tax=Teichococcus rhizosphaerae TaxID=1335062 RepID=A0A2C7AF25_9PROT|nr:FecR domain-containing protein [Pseudoroseomonas rhizosphaerae]PHK95267.1 iron dicitrate transport regulator FecR [Pseudoroseomonas rhizosphaerae]
MAGGASQPCGGVPAPPGRARPVPRPAAGTRQACPAGQRRLRPGGAAAPAAGGTLSALLLLAALCAGSRPWPAAGHSSGTGEISGLSLPDGSRATLGSGSAIDLRYDGKGRTIRLARGEVMLDVRPDPQRPLTVRTPQGSVQALGTRFTVRRAAERTWVAVEESRVRACIHAERCVTLGPGEAAWLAAGAIEGPFPAPPHAAAWAEGRLIVENRPLVEVLAQLARYRRGGLRYDAAELEGIMVSGVLPLREPDKALAALEESLPVRIRRDGRFRSAVERR